MGRFGVGQPLRRLEKDRLQTGQGRYCDDINLPRQAPATLLRSPHVHARIRAINTTAAEAAPGVPAVYASADLIADAIGDIPCEVPMPGKKCSGTIMPPHPVLARERVMGAGKPEQSALRLPS